MNKICFICVGQPVGVPRLLKEAQILAQNGYEITILYGFWSEWGYIHTNELKKKYPTWTWIEAGGNSFENSLWYNFTRLRNKILSTIPFTKNSHLVVNRNTIDLIKTAKTIQADLYIAHNAGAIYPAYLAAKKHNAKFGVDIEDAYAFIEAENVDQVNKTIQALEKKILPKAAYLTCASPLYIDFYKRFYQGLSTITPILNVFEDIDITKEKPYKDRQNLENLSLYWFSQSIGKRRGLEQIILALNKLNRTDIELHLRGDCTAEIKKQLFELANPVVRNMLFFHEVVSNEELAIRTSEHDVGLALETGFSVNNELAISNKLFQYLNSGLMILASQTQGQNHVMQAHQEIGFSINIDNIDTLADKINYLATHREEVEKMKYNAKKLSQAVYNWQLESKKFLTIIQDVLN